jgi:hypothetical protein
LADAGRQIVDRLSIGAVGTRRRSRGRSAAAVLDRTSEADKRSDSNSTKHSNKDGSLEGGGIRKKRNRKPGIHAPRT